jgi:hypothetical protein
MNSFDFSMYDHEDNSPITPKKVEKKPSEKKSQTFDFDAYDFGRPVQDKEVPTRQNNDELEKENFYKILQEDEGDTQRDIERSQAQLASRGIEAVAGLPGDLFNFAGSLFGLDPNAPGSQELRKFSEDITSGYTKPKDEFEEGFGELLQDISLMALPGAKHYSFARNIGIPVLGNLVKQGLKSAGTEESTQTYSKVGTMIALDLISQNKNGLKDHIADLYKRAENAVPNGVSIDATGLRKSLDILEKELQRGEKDLQLLIP